MEMSGSKSVEFRAADRNAGFSNISMTFTVRFLQPTLPETVAVSKQLT